MTIDTLRNWELNGLLRIKRKENGYRVYNEDIVPVCDKLLTSLENAEDECNKMIIQIKKMKKINPPV